MEDTRRFFFLHLQKTGGTALWRRLQGHFPASELYPGPGDGQPPATVLSVEHLLERWRVRHHEIRVVTGHFPLCTTELLDVPFTTFTLLRDPVERTLSYLRHHRAMTPSESERSLEEIYADPVRFELLHNHMVKMLALTPGEMTEGALTHIRFSRDRLEEAQQRLREIDVVGLQEDFDRFCAELTARFGWDLGPPVFMNRTAPVEVGEAFRARIANENELDVELFEFARELVAGRDHSAPYNTTGI